MVVTSFSKAPWRTTLSLFLVFKLSFLQTSSNIKSTVMKFKPLIGRKFEDPWIQDDMRGMFNDIKKNEDGSIGFHVSERRIEREREKDRERKRESELVL